MAKDIVSRPTDLVSSCPRRSAGHHESIAARKTAQDRSEAAAEAEAARMWR
jgi:hypothetical protein